VYVFMVQVGYASAILSELAVAQSGDNSWVDPAYCYIYCRLSVLESMLG
jgi:hypothetical protein